MKQGALCGTESVEEQAAECYPFDVLVKHVFQLTDIIGGRAGGRVLPALLPLVAIDGRIEAGIIVHFILSVDFVAFVHLAQVEEKLVEGVCEVLALFAEDIPADHAQFLEVGFKILAQSLRRI